MRTERTYEKKSGEKESKVVIKTDWILTLLLVRMPDAKVLVRYFGFKSFVGSSRLGTARRGTANQADCKGDK